MGFVDFFFAVFAVGLLVFGTYCFAISQSESSVELATRRQDSSRKPRKKKISAKPKSGKFNLKTPGGMASAMHYKLQELEVSLDSGPPISKPASRVITLGFEPGSNFADKHFRNNHFEIICRAIKRAPHDCRFVPRLPHPYPHYSGIEVPLSPNVEEFEPVDFYKILDTKEYKSAGIPLIIGENTFGAPLIMDLAKPKNSHALIAGSTGSGKTTMVDAALFGLVLMPAKKRPYIVVIDAAKGGEDLGKFTAAPNIYTELADNNEKAKKILMLISRSLDKRTKNDKPIVVVIDEIPALLNEKANEHASDCKSAIVDIAGVGRSKRVHLVVLTQNASVTVVPSESQNNFRGRICLQCGPNQTTQILGPGWNVDASKLFGYGDLYTVANGQLERAQAPYIDENDIKEWMKENGRKEGESYPLEIGEKVEKEEIILSGNKEDLYKLGRAIVSGYIDDGRCYGKAKLASITGLSEYEINTKLLPDLEKMGVIGPVKGRKPRHVLIPNHSRLDALLASLGEKKTYPPDRGVLLENHTFH